MPRAPRGSCPWAELMARPNTTIMARAKNRITQSDLAARMQVAGVTIERDSISRIERGTRIVTDYELKIFSKALGVSMEWLTDESGAL